MELNILRSTRIITMYSADFDCKFSISIGFRAVLKMPGQLRMLFFCGVRERPKGNFANSNLLNNWIRDTT